MTRKRKSASEINRNMSAIRSKGNVAEVALGRKLFSLGFRYRKYSSELGRPDFVFRREQVAVFVDGDYWHARVVHEGGQQALSRWLLRLRPETRPYWRQKFLRRVERDSMVTSELIAGGWRVIRIWESEVRADVDKAAKRVATIVLKRRPKRPKRRVRRASSQS
jgi:DNA mismatch endonuclease, patch repair protein